MSNKDGDKDAVFGEDIYEKYGEDANLALDVEGSKGKKQAKKSVLV